MERPGVRERIGLMPAQTGLFSRTVKFTLISHPNRLLQSVNINTMVPKPAARAACYGDKDVWGIFTPLAIQYKAVNLGQGFPNIPAPEFIKV